MFIQRVNVICSTGFQIEQVCLCIVQDPQKCSIALVNLLLWSSLGAAVWAEFNVANPIVQQKEKETRQRKSVCLVSMFKYILLN